MGSSDDDLGGPLVEERLGCLHDGATGVDHVVDQDADPSLDVTDHLEELDLIRDIGITPLVNDRQWAAQPISPPFGNTDPTGVWGDNRAPEALGATRQPRSARECFERKEVVNGTVEEALNLGRVQIDR